MGKGLFQVQGWVKYYSRSRVGKSIIPGPGLGKELFQVQGWVKKYPSPELGTGLLFVSG